MPRVTDPATGEKSQPSATFRTEKEADAWLAKQLTKRDDGTYRPDKGLTVRELLVRYLSAMEIAGKRPATLDHYATVNARIVAVLGALKVDALTPKHLADLVKADRAAGRSDRTAQMDFCQLKRACRWGFAEAKVLRHDPFVGVKRPSAETPPMVVWTAEESRHYLAFTAKDRLAHADGLLLGRIMRRGELCGLRWPSVNLPDGYLDIDETRVVAGGKVIDSRAKTKAGRRRLPLDAHLIGLLRTAKARQSAEKLAAGEAYQDHGFVVCDELGRSYYPGWISVRFKKLAQQAGLPPLKLHGLRHTGATLMLADGVPLKVVQEMAGHSSPVITLASYAHVLPGQAEAAGEALSNRLFG
jgi:integrase